MFCLRYDHQTKKNLYVALLPRAKRNEREAAYPKDARSRPLTIPGEDRCPSQSTSILMCMLLIVVRSFIHSVMCEVFLLLDQIKPIEQLVPVN